jgi:hypothetical protein
MEINHWGDTILGVVAQEDISQGRMVCLTTNTFSRNFGSQTDLPGVELPVDVNEATRARYVLTFESDDRSIPIYDPQPAFGYALRYGFDQVANAPFTADVYLTHQNVAMGGCTLIVPSGAGCLAFGEGIYTVESGCYIYDPLMEVPGTQLSVHFTNAADRGKLEVPADGAQPVAEVIRFYSEDSRLTFKILH